MIFRYLFKKKKEKEAPSKREEVEGQEDLYITDHKTLERIGTMQAADSKSCENEYYLSGLKFFNSGEYTQALEYFQEAIHSYPNNKSGYQMLAETYQKMGKISKAEDTLQRMSKIGSQLDLTPNQNESLVKNMNSNLIFSVSSDIQSIGNSPQNNTKPKENVKIEPYDPKKELSHFMFPILDFLNEEYLNTSDEEGVNVVPVREILSSDKFRNSGYELPIGIGETNQGEIYVFDLVKMPHLLIAGATGQGKTMGIQAIITSLLYAKHPSEMKFVIVDPKDLEYSSYSAMDNYYLAKIPFGRNSIITDKKQVPSVLQSLCVEMDMRYELLKKSQTRSVKDYNNKFCSRELSPSLGFKYLPYIVVIIDDFDMVITANKKVEEPLTRLAQLSRSTGIHLIISAQRPSTDVVTSNIKANFPARMAFRMVSAADSRTILESVGANQLAGNGDMVFKSARDLVHLQCAFVDVQETDKIMDFIKKQSQSYPLQMPYELPCVPSVMDDDFTDSYNPNELDPLLIEAAVLVVQTQAGSASAIQRKLSLGYSRAGHIMEQLEDLRIVGPGTGSKPRQVLVKTEAELRQRLIDLQLL